jgi:WD40 repeat protein
MERLLLGTMHHTVEADHRCGNREGCLGGTRGDVLRQLDNWLEDTQGQRVFWLNGLAGTGKSTIAQTFAEIAFAEGKLGASFFCSQGSEDRSNLQSIFPTLAFQLAYQYPLFREELLQVLRANPGIGRQSLCSQLEKVIVGPFEATGISTLIIIDALDECRDEEPASAILSMLSRCVDQIPNVKFFITGRPEPRIRSGFRLESLVPITEVLKLHEIKPEVVDSDIGLFFQRKLTNLVQNRSDCNLTEGWPSPLDIEILCKKAAGFFIYASTVIKFVTSKTCTPAEQLNRITSLPQSTSYEGKSGLDLLYTQVLEQAIDDVDMDDKELHSRFKAVVGTVVLVFNPLSVKALSDFLREPGTPTTLRSLHSLLLVPDSTEDPVHIYHKSFPDFITDPKRCKDQQFLVDPSVHHKRILLSCLDLMGERLKRNICDLDDRAVLSEVKDLPFYQKIYIGDALGYACQFWTRHLVEIPGNSHCVEEVYKAIDGFFTTNLLFWIEVLCLMGNLNGGVYALKDVQQWCILVSCAEPSTEETCIHTLVQAEVTDKWTHDSQHFLLEFFDTIRNSPSQIYYSALPLCPPSSWLYSSYTTELSREVRVVKRLPAGWDICFRTVALDNCPLGLAHWKDVIALGLESGDIVTLDGVTGTQVAVLSGHTGSVTSLGFSSDGTFLFSGSHDQTLKLWDIQTGGVVRTLYGHTNWVLSISISFNCKTIASGSKDNTIRLWDIQTGECLCIIEQLDSVKCVGFSPTNSQHLISVSGHVVQWWDISNLKIMHTYEGSYATFSSDGTHLALCKGRLTTVQNSDSGAIVAQCHTEDFSTSCCFSPNGRLMAIADFFTIYIWNVMDPHPYLIETLRGHISNNMYLTFSSSSLISTSWDQLVKFWQIGASLTDVVASDPESTLSGSGIIGSVILQVESGIAVTGDSDGVMKIWDISTGLCKASFQTPAREGLMDAQMIDGRLVVVWLGDEGINIWDTDKDELLQLVGVVERWPIARDLRISGDGTKVFLLIGKLIQAWSMWTGEAMGEVELEDESSLNLLHMGGSRVCLKFPNSLTLGWDFGISGPPVPLPNTSLEKSHLEFIGGSGRLREGPFWIKDTVTGKEVFRLSGRYARPHKAQWNGLYLVVCYSSREALVLDFNQVLPQ